MKRCKQGYYYCYKDKKCKRIPGGYRVGLGGYLRKEREEEKSEDNSENNTKKNGNGNVSNGNGNGNGGNGNGSGSSGSNGGNGGGVSEGWSGKYKKSIDCDNPKGFSQKAHCQGKKKTKAMNEAKNGDHEVAMAQSQLKKSAENIKKVRKALGKKEKDIPAWMQAKITDTAHDTDAAAGYVDKMDEQYMTQQQKAERYAETLVNKARGAAEKYNAAKKAAQNVNVTPGSVTVRAEEVIIEKRDGKSSKDKGYSLRDWFKGGGWKQTGGKYDGKPCAKQPGQKTKPYCRDADDRAAMSKEERNKRARKKRAEDPNPNRKGKAKNVTQESYSDWRQDLDEGKKDACYHKVKSRYSVWPSAYASGALVKCRKVGAANWGNKSKKNESVDYSNWRDEFIPTEYETTDLIKADPIKASPSNLLKINEKKDIPADVKKIAGELDAAVKMHKSQAKRLRKSGISEENLDEKCWKGYEKKGMKTMFGKRYPNCVKKKKTRKEEVELIGEGSRLDGPEERKKDLDKKYNPKGKGNEPISSYFGKQAKLQKEAKSDGDPCWDTHEMKGMKKKGNRMVPNCVRKEQVSDWRSELSEGSAWTKKEGKNEKGGLNEKGRKSYERENPGSDLKRPSKKVGNKRRASFCARMKGMKKKLTSKKTANDPNSRINKSLRAWNC